MRPRAALLLAVPVLLACAAAAFAASWQLPATTLSPAGQDASAPQVVVDGSGVATAVWSPSGGAQGPIRASRFEDGAWSAPREISSPTADTTYAVATVDRAGIVTVIWTTTRGADQIVQASRYSGGTWSAPQDLSLAGGSAAYPDVQADPSGVVTAVWQRADNGNVVIQSARFSGGAWTTPQDVATASVGLVVAAYPQVVVDQSGVATAAWMMSSPGQVVIRASRYSGGAWGTPQLLSPAGGSEFASQPKLVADTSGVVTVVWSQALVGGFEVRYARFTGGTWAASAVIAGSANSGTAYPEPVVDAAGVVTTVWYRGPSGANEVVAARLSGGTWSAVQQISDAGVDAELPEVAVDPSGNLMATWEQSDGGDFFVAAARYANGGWGGSQVISPTAGTGRAPEVALDAKGNATVAWAGFANLETRVQAAQFFTVPSPPRSATASPGDGSVEVTWTAPANDAGSPITGYEVTMTPGGRTCTTTAPTTRCTFSGLANGTAYSFSITATNALGTSWGSTVTATPRVPASGGSGAGGGAATAPLTATITTSRRTVATGKRITASIRVRNTGKATATKVVACIKAPKGLSIVQKPRAKKRLRNPACFTVKTLAVGTQVTRKITLRASASRRVTRSVTGTARAKGIAKVKATPRKVVITVARQAR